MMKLLVLLALFAGSVTSFAQTFPVEIIRDNGDPSRRINLVFLADGYQESELDTYITDVKRVVNGLFIQSPFKEYENYFNVYAIKVPSVQSGANHPQNTSDGDCSGVPVKTVNNYFGSSFDTGGIHRLLVPTRLNLVYSVLADNFPMYDQVFVLVNSPYYGGSGGPAATASTEANSSEVAIHEIGHSFAGLADEYWAGPAYAFEQPNLTQESSPTKVKWKNWIGDNAIGVYAHAESPSWYRPHQGCKMRFLNSPFCSVCKEGFVETIHRFVNPLISYSPLEKTQHLVDSIVFSVQVDKPTTNKVTVTWMKNNEVMTTQQDKETISLHLTSLMSGENSLKAVVIDNSPLTRSQSHLTNHVYEIEWVISTEAVVGTEVTSTISEYDVSVFPNPVDKELNLSYSLRSPSLVQVELSDAMGKTVKTLVDENQSEGKYTLTFQDDELEMKSAGVYYLRLKINGVSVIEKVIRR
ncbi:MAG TPA: M64 family metallopeptidase [Chryseolinea sp.]|nr:M64 family metallopeptidase [Chryseolinea sp.]